MIKKIIRVGSHQQAKESCAFVVCEAYNILLRVTNVVISFYTTRSGCLFPLPLPEVQIVL